MPDSLVSVMKRTLGGSFRTPTGELGRAKPAELTRLLNDQLRDETERTRLLPSRSSSRLATAALTRSIPSLPRSSSIDRSEK